MQKSLPISFSLAVCLTLTGCTAFKKSQTWEKVTETRGQRPEGGADPSNAYAKKLHTVLTANKVEHKLVTYQYRYKTRLREEAVGTRTAVLYKDETNPSNPWWLMDERLGKPLWLPNEEVDRQVAFYLRRKADVVEQKAFSGGGEEQTPAQMVASSRPVVSPREPAVTQIAKVQRTHVSPVAIAQARPQGPAAVPMGETAFIHPARFAPAPHVSVAAAPAPHPAFASAPTAIEARFDQIFRTYHGTDFDPASPLDRRKMETIRHARLDGEAPGTRTF
jgi:hypothetical protein